MKRLILCLVFLLFPTLCFAANTIDAEDGGVTLTAIDSDWTWSDSYTTAADSRGIRVEYIMFNPAAAGDKCVIKDTDENGIIIFSCECASTYDDRVLPFNGNIIRPFLDVGDGSYNASATLTIKRTEK